VASRDAPRELVRLGDGFGPGEKARRGRIVSIVLAVRRQRQGADGWRIDRPANPSAPASSLAGAALIHRAGGCAVTGEKALSYHCQEAVAKV